jgi:hypothetical protein
MAKYKRYDYKQSLMIPVSLEEQLMPGTLEFAIHTLVENRMDMSVFDLNYQNDETGRSALDFPQKSRQGQAQSFSFCFSYSAGQR